MTINLIIDIYLAYMIIAIVSSQVIIYKYMYILDDAFTKKQNLSEVLYEKGTRFYCYSVKYPFVFFKLKELNFKFHIVMIINSLMIWFLIISFIYALTLRMQIE